MMQKTKLSHTFLLLCTLTVSYSVSAKIIGVKNDDQYNYIVQKNDNLQTIAKRFYGKDDFWQTVQKLNPEIKNPNRIYPGQALNIPKLKNFSKPKGRWFLGMSFGTISVSEQTLFNDYVSLSPALYQKVNWKNDQQTGGNVYQIFAGYSLPIKSKRDNTFTWLPAIQFSAGIWKANNFSLKGNFYRWDKGFNNNTWLFGGKYPYSFQLDIKALRLESNLDLLTWKNFTPYIGIGVNYAETTVNAFKATGSIQNDTVEFPKNDKQQIFANINFGARYAFNEHWGITLNYSYMPDINLSIKDAKSGGYPSIAPDLMAINLSIVSAGIIYKF